MRSPKIPQPQRAPLPASPARMAQAPAPMTGHGGMFRTFSPSFMGFGAQRQGRRSLIGGG